MSSSGIGGLDSSVLLGFYQAQLAASPSAVAAGNALQAQALAAQTYPRDRLEVIVLDGGSTDSTEDEVRVTAEAAGLTVFYADNPRRTAATGFNLGLTLAHGDVIVRLDGHSRPADDFIAASVQALRETGADAIGGPIETRGYGAVGRAIAPIEQEIGLGGRVRGEVRRSSRELLTVAGGRVEVLHQQPQRRSPGRRRRQMHRLGGGVESVRVIVFEQQAQRGQAIPRRRGFRCGRRRDFRLPTLIHCFR